MAQQPTPAFLLGEFHGQRSLEGFPGGSEVKVSACNVGALGSIPGSGRSPEEGNGNLLSILAWRIPWMEGEPSGATAGGHKESDMAE